MLSRAHARFAWFRQRYLRLGGRVALLSLALLFISLRVYAVPGDLDPTFDGDGIVITPMGTGDSVVWSLAIQVDGKLVVGGQAVNGANGYDLALARYHPDGTLDNTFNGTGKVLTTLSAGQDVIGSVALQSDGKIVASGQMSTTIGLDIMVARYNPDGTLDTTFDGDGVAITNSSSGDELVRDTIIQPDGKIVVAGHTLSSGSDADFLVARYNTDGSLDTTFDGDGIVITDFNGGADGAFMLERQSDGKLIVMGDAANGVNGQDVAMARYNPNGSLDTSFDGDGKVITTLGPGADRAAVVAIQPDGNLIVGGQVDNAGNVDIALLRYTTAGALDPTFDGDGIVITTVDAGTDFLYDLLLQPDGKIAAVGGSSNGTKMSAALLRYNPDGTLDGTFGGGDGIILTPLSSLNSRYWVIAQQVDSKLVVGGEADTGTTGADFAVARYLNDSTPPPLP